MSIADHVAIIMDGNGRWALQKGKSRNYFFCVFLEKSLTAVARC